MLVRPRVLIASDVREALSSDVLRPLNSVPVVHMHGGRLLGGRIGRPLEITVIDRARIRERRNLEYAVSGAPLATTRLAGTSASARSGFLYR